MEDDGKDVGLAKDFLFFLKNAVALEDHAISSYAQTKDKKQFELAMFIRRIRSKWEFIMVKKSKNQIYCESKHAPGMAMGLMEMGNRFASLGENELADECFKDSSDCEALTIHLNDFFKIIDKENILKKNNINKCLDNTQLKKKGLFSKKEVKNESKI